MYGTHGIVLKIGLFGEYIYCHDLDWKTTGMECETRQPNHTGTCPILDRVYLRSIPYVLIFD